MDSVGKAVPSSRNTGPRDFSAEVHGHFAGRAAPLEPERISLLRRVGNILRSDWTMTEFDGRDVKRWIDTALDGDAGALRELGGELRRIEDSPDDDAAAMGGHCAGRGSG